MLDFHKYLMRHGESAVQDIVERVERLEGIRPVIGLSLEKRWEAVMFVEQPEQRQAA